jgi:hypothetical protein
MSFIQFIHDWYLYLHAFNFLYPFTQDPRESVSV